MSVNEPEHDEVRTLLQRYAAGTEASAFEVERLKRRVLRPAVPKRTRMAAWVLGWSGAVVAVAAAAFVLRPATDRPPAQLADGERRDGGESKVAVETIPRGPRPQGRPEVRGSASVLASRAIDLGALEEARADLAAAAKRCGSGRAELTTDRFGAIVQIRAPEDRALERCLVDALAHLELRTAAGSRASTDDGSSGWVEIRLERQEIQE